MTMICGNCGGLVEPHASECCCYLTLNDKSMEPKEEIKFLTKDEKEILRATKEFFESQGKSYNKFVHYSILNAIRETKERTKTEITILTEQRDGYKKELQAQNALNKEAIATVNELMKLLGQAQEKFDSSQEEVKRLKEHSELDKSAILQYQAQVKELTELVKELRGGVPF